MTGLKTNAYPQVVVSGNSASGILFVDTVTLINFDRIGNLDTLLAAHRTIVVTPEVQKEAVTNALASGNPNAITSAQRIDSWLQQHTSTGEVIVDKLDPNRGVFSGQGAGETSILDYGDSALN